MLSAADKDLDTELRRQANQKSKMTQDPLEMLRLKILARGGQMGIKQFGRMFRGMNDDDNSYLNKEEFLRGVRDYSGMSDHDIGPLFQRFDTNNDGRVNYEEFIAALRPPMSEARKKLISEAFNKLNRNGDKYVDVSDLRGVYNCREHPKYKSGEWSENKCLFEWLKTFDNGMDNENNIKITKDEFMNYYSGVSASIDSDAYFDLMMRNSWKI